MEPKPAKALALLLLFSLSALSACSSDMSKEANIPATDSADAIFEETLDGYIIHSPGGAGTTWGNWQADWTVCPRRQFVNGFTLEIEPKQGRGDDTSANRVIIHCSSLDGNQKSSISGHGMSWGRPSAPAYCDKSQFGYGYRIGYEPHKDDQDDTALNSIEIVCKSPKDWRSPDNWISISGPWAKAKTQSTYCPPSTFISGIKSRVEPHQGSGDDTALNDIKVLCRRY